MRKQKAFTLIELLVVIAIIGLLASIVMINLNKARGKARDARRLSDMREIRIALEMFYDAKGRYPGSSDGISNGGEYVGDGAGSFESALAPYMPNVPGDPRHDGSTYYYAYDPRHCTDDPIGSCNCAGETGAVLGFYRSETSPSGLTKEVCSGGDMGLDNAEYNIAVYPAPP